MRIDFSPKQLGAVIGLVASISVGAVAVKSAGESHDQTAENAKQLKVLIDIQARLETTKQAERKQIRQFCRQGKLDAESEECQKVNDR